MQVVNAVHWFPAIKQANASIALHPLVLPRNGKGFIKKNHNQPTKEKNKQTTPKPRIANFFFFFCFCCSSLSSVFSFKSLKFSIQWVGWDVFLEDNKSLMRLELDLIRKRLIGVGEEPNDNASLIIMKISHEEETAGINIKASLAFWFLEVKQNKICSLRNEKLK